MCHRLTLSLRKKCPYCELFWSVFSRIRTEYGEIRSIISYSVRMGENADQNNSEYWQFSRSVCLQLNLCPQQGVRNFIYYIQILSYLQKLKIWFLHTVFFYISVNNSRSKNNPEHSFVLRTVKQETYANSWQDMLNSLVIRARQSFQFLIQITWFLGNKRALPRCKFQIDKKRPLESSGCIDHWMQSTNLLTVVIQNNVLYQERTCTKM